MATDMQALSSGFPTQRAPQIQDATDRQRVAHSSDPSRNFESMLGRAEARHVPTKQDAPTVPKGDRVAPHAREVAHSTSESSSRASERSAVAETEDQPQSRGERTGEKAQRSADESEEISATQESKQNNHEQAAAFPQEMMLAAMMVPVPAASPVEQQPPQTETAENPSEAPINAVATLPTDLGTEGSTPTTSLVAAVPGAEVGTQKTFPSEPGATAATAKETAPGTQPAGKEMGQIGTKELASIAAQVPAAEEHETDRTASDAGVRIDSDHVNSALAAMTAPKQNLKMSEQSPLDHADRSAILDAVAQATSLGEGQAGAGTERFLEQNGQSLSDSPGGTDRSLPNQSPSAEQNVRPAFMDRMNELQQPAPAVSESAFGRSESGQTTTVLRASESERLGELRGMASLSQSVTLDLDPLDMGPLRVRVMMSDQTVHAHIRTEHGELGQGLLQQGQSLESSLRSTGLEMGMLRVTVDQQQGRGDNAWMFQQQQQQGRPSSPPMSQAAAREDDRGTRIERGAGSNERVSFFA